MFVNITSIISTSGPECDIDMCAVNGNPIECGNGTCIGGKCNCDTGYVEIDNFCEETCADNPCKELIKNNFGYYGSYLYEHASYQY